MFNGLDMLWAVGGFGAITLLILHYWPKRAMPTKPPNSSVLPNTYRRYVDQPGPQRLLAFNGHQHTRLSPQQLTTTAWLDEQTVGLPDLPVSSPREWEAS